MKSVLKQTEPLETGLRRIAVDLVDSALHALDEPDGRDAAIHTVRKQCKRMRALLRLFRYGLGADEADELRVFRDIGRGLSGARDSRVVFDVYERIDKEFGSVLERSVAAAIRQDLIADCQAAASGSWGTGEAPWSSDDVRRQLRAARSRARRWQLSPGNDEILVRGLIRNYRLGRKAHKTALQTQAIRDFHTLRKRAKDFTYALEFLADRYAEVVEERLVPVTRLTELLGELHDLEVFRTAARRAASARNPEAVEMLGAVTERRSRVIEAEAGDLAKAIFAEKPARLAQGCRDARRIDRAAS